MDNVRVALRLHPVAVVAPVDQMLVKNNDAHFQSLSPGFRHSLSCIQLFTMKFTEEKERVCWLFTVQPSH